MYLFLVNTNGNGWEIIIENLLIIISVNQKDITYCNCKNFFVTIVLKVTYTGLSFTFKTKTSLPNQNNAALSN